MSKVIPAATLVLFRERDGEAAEHLFVERAATMSFAAGATVFPGGRVEPSDHALAARTPELDGDDAAARIAAIRETIEESGVAAAIRPVPDITLIARLRDGLAQGGDFAELLDANGLTLRLEDLVPFARWRPDLPEPRVFDTRFYLTRMPHDGPVATVDATENVRLFWATAQHVLDAADRAEVQIIFPTRRNLERLAVLRNFTTAIEHLDQFETPPPLVAPWIEERGDGERYLCIPEGQGYPVTSERLASVRRG